MRIKDFRLELVHDHPVVAAGGRRAVIDTGAPSSMAAPGIVSQALGTPVQWLVGTDRLRHHRVLFDWDNGVLRVGGEPIHGDVLELTEAMGVYQVPLDTPLGQIHAVLDTGAQISYAPRRAVAALEPCGVAKDFYPMLGEFEVELYELRIRFAGRSIVAKMGVLPPILEALLSATGSEWILGTDVLRQRSFQLDLAHNRMIAHTPAPVEGGGGFPLLLRLLADEERRRERAEARVVTSPVTG